MKSVLLSAIIVLAMGASAASADNSYGPPTVSPGSVLRNLQRQDYRHISWPLRSGRFYEVRAINPHGHPVKLYIDTHSGRIADVKR